MTEAIVLLKIDDDVVDDDDDNDDSALSEMYTLNVKCSVHHPTHNVT